MCAALALATVLAYGSFAAFEFVNWDDNAYVTGNAQVRAGLTLESARWAITATDAHNWHPLTWLSHMLDVELFGLDPVAHHRTNLALHVASSCLLLLAFLRMTGALWRSAFVAALFALHPLHVESVAWVAERKDVLSALCFTLVLLLWARYAERPSASRYACVLAMFAVGLTAKPMLVTVPAVLLLLDVWPLGRLRLAPTIDRPRAGRLALEKLPLFALSAAASVMTVVAQQTAISFGARYTFADRLGNALVSYVRYLAGTFWPTDLSISYWHPSGWPASAVVGSALLLAAITAATLRVVRTRPFLAVGWLIFLGMLVPVIGVVQVGEQAMADRYMYLPSIGLFVMLAWGVNAAVPEFPGRARALALAAGALLLACAWLTHAQVQVWRNSPVLWQHARAVDPENPLALEVLGVLAEQQGRQVEALGFYRRAIEIDPRRQNSQYNLGNLLRWFGRPAEALGPLLEAVRLRPDFAVAYEALGHVYRDLGQSQAALQAFQRSVELNPKGANAQYNLGIELLQAGGARDALGPLDEAARLRPDFTMAFAALAEAHAVLGERDAAVAAGERALALARAQGQAELAAQIEAFLAKLRAASP
ncbi:MAG: tetratricopeptide repeat protein [Myxococcota bacterium]